MILVTGASGLLGANFLVTAHRRGMPVGAVYHRHSVRLSGVAGIRGDLTDAAVAAEVCRTLRPRWVVHCAAATDVDWCEEHPQEAWRLNVEMPRHLASAAHQIGAGVLYVSTDAVFDGQAGGYREDDPPSPVNVYAKTKLAGEEAVRAELDRWLIVRTNFYGWNLVEKLSLAEWILSRLEARRPVPGFCDVTFAPLLVNDLSEILLEMVGRALEGLYHVAGSGPLSKYDFAVACAETFGLDASLVRPSSVADAALRAARPRNIWLETARACGALGKPMPDVASGLRRFKALRDSGFVNALKALRGACT